MIQMFEVMVIESFIERVSVHLPDILLPPNPGLSLRLEEALRMNYPAKAGIEEANGEWKRKEGQD